MLMRETDTFGSACSMTAIALLGYLDFVGEGLAGRLLAHGTHRLSDVSGNGACSPRLMGQRSPPGVRREPLTPLLRGCPVAAGTPKAHIDIAATDPLR